MIIREETKAAAVDVGGDASYIVLVLVVGGPSSEICPQPAEIIPSTWRAPRGSPLVILLITYSTSVLPYDLIHKRRLPGPSLLSLPSLPPLCRTDLSLHPTYLESIPSTVS